ncbi:MAG: ABC transporter ATP-binding protein [Bacteroidales bacterium]|nr:ABC transporter ATP-binding protein [Bacteroidales bacterium]MBN2758261.1 ABC transporter ATP-binding protein [Bacteroidales bacterium]
MNKSVIVNNLSKKYGETKAIENINFEVNNSEIFGLIGPDGAGKSTIIRILTSLILADSGKCTLNGLDVVKDYKKIRKIIGYMPGRFSLYQDLTVEENLKFFATVFGTSIEENYDLIKDIYHQIESFKKRRAGKLSGGMKQKLALSCALIHKPEILVLDEPTTGVDAVSRKEFWDMLKKLKEKDITIIVSTPYMDEASLCDRVALIQKGNIMQINTPEKIINNFTKELLSIKSKNIYKLLKDLRKYPEYRSAFPFGQNIHFTSNETIADIENIKNFLINNGHQNIDIKAIKANIEDCFMELMT